MSFNSLLQHNINTSRLKSGAGITKLYQPNLVGVAVMIQPLSAEYAAKTGMVFGRAYHCYAPINTDIQITDKVIDQDGKEYRVTGSLKRNYGGTPHLTFLMTEEVRQGPDQ